MITLVLLPGLDVTGHLFAPFLTALGNAMSARVVAYSSRTADFEEHMDQARRALPKARPFVLLRKSYSGPIAVRLAAERPPGLLGLVVVATFVTCPSLWLSPFRPVLAVMPSVRMPTMLATSSAISPHELSCWYCRGKRVSVSRLWHVRRSTRASGGASFDHRALPRGD